MKNAVNLLYTTVFKSMIFIFCMVFSWCTAAQTMDITQCFIRDDVSAANVFLQWDSFDYKQSLHLEKEIEATIENILLNSLKYKSEDFIASHESDRDFHTLDYYLRLSDEEYRNNVEYLESLRYVDYAVVNHDTDMIISSLEAADGQKSDFAVRSCFSQQDDSLVVILNAKNPLFEKGTMSDYSDFVTACAENYENDFDLSIKRIEEIVEILEGGKSTLDESLSLFEDYLRRG